MDTNPTGTAPLTTAGNEGSQPASVQTESVEVLKAKLLLAERERDEKGEALLRANRAVEAGRKFEKYEEFQASVLGEINNLKESDKAKDKTIEDLKNIIAGKAAVTPFTTTGSTPPAAAPQTTDEEIRTRNMFGLPITQK